MAISKIDICNLSLALLGEDSIRSFDEKNKRARMCDVFFDQTRDYLLSRFDWPFARKYAILRALDTTGMSLPTAEYPYQLPNDCRTPRDLHPPGSREWWTVRQNVLYCRYPASDEYDIGLYYTVQQVDTSLFSDTFVNLLALALAVRMGPSITQDRAFVKMLSEQYEREQREVWESDANIGNDYRTPDEDPNNDTFVSPTGYISEEEYS